MSEAIDKLLAEAGPSGTGSKAWEDQLDPEVRGVLETFQAWLEAEGKVTPATCKAYRAYVAQSIVRLQSGEDYKALSTDLRSGVNAFVRFSEATAAPVEPVEDEPEA